MKNLVGSGKNPDEEWYTDDEMNALLDSFLRDNQEVEFLHALLGTDWREGHLKENLEQFNIQRAETIARGEKVKTRVIAPVNLNNNHWVLVYFIYQEDANALPNVYYFDPLGEGVNDRVKKEIMKQELSPGSEITDISERVQCDGHNCGP